jgi:hypothetical protein
MSFKGIVKNGVVILPPEAKLPDGTEVEIVENETLAGRTSLLLRDHGAFLNSYVPEDEGLYEDGTGR